MRRLLTRLDRRPALWLLLGVLLLAAANLRWGLAAVAWVAPVPWLRYLRLTSGARSRLLFAAALYGAWTLAVVKIVTDPLPVAIAAAFALPFAVGFGVGFAIHDRLRRRLDPARAALAFAASMAVAEWALYAFGPMGTWGMGVNTQLGNLPLAQLVALTGPLGVGFLIHLAAAVLEEALEHGWSPIRRPAIALGAALVVAHLGGQLRLALDEGRGDETVLVAAIGTDSDVTGLPLPELDEVIGWEAAMHRRTRTAAAAGARLVAWTEAATLVLPERESTFVDGCSALAAELRIELVVGYIVPLPGEALRYENKALWIRPDGAVEITYLKHRPVPGEPAVRGIAPHRAVETELGRGSLALCYDYDFPGLARAHARLGVDLAVVPSSDWRGIDPIHTDMAALRAIEGGQSILRSTRWGMSAGIDPLGRQVGRRSDFDAGERILMVQLPRVGRTTLYGRLGEWFVVGCGLLLVLLSAAALRSRHDGERPVDRQQGAARGL